jgi:hypothetical protein
MTLATNSPFIPGELYELPLGINYRPIQRITTELHKDLSANWRIIRDDDQVGMFLGYSLYHEYEKRNESLEPVFIFDGKLIVLERGITNGMLGIQKVSLL